MLEDWVLPYLPTRVATSVRFLARLKHEFDRDNLTHVAAGIAFYGLLALFPGITTALLVAGLLIDTSTIMNELDTLSAILPPEAAKIILDQASAVAAQSQQGLGAAFLIGLGLTLYSASKGMQSLMDGLNMAHNEIETRGFFHRTALKLALTLLLIFGLVMGVSATIILPAVLVFLGLADQSGAWVASIRWPVLAALTIVGLRILYRFGPDHTRINRRLITPGSIVAAVLWVAGSLAFSFYVSNFASYNETFGALGGVIILLMWLWLSGLAILIGAEIDSALETAEEEREARLTRAKKMEKRRAFEAQNY